MISIADHDFLAFVQGVIQDIKFLQGECQRAALNYAPDEAYKAVHQKYETLLGDTLSRIASESEEQTEAEDASPAQASSLTEPSESEDEAQSSV